MAGSYMHISQFKDGKRSFRGTALLDHLGDAYEALEECYDMIEWLADSQPDRIAEAWMWGHLMKHRPDLLDEKGHATAEVGRLETEYTAELVEPDEDEDDG